MSAWRRCARSGVASVAMFLLLFSAPAFALDTLAMPGATGAVAAVPASGTCGMPIATTNQALTVFGPSWAGPMTSVTQNIIQSGVSMSGRIKNYALMLGGGFALVTMLFDIAMAMTRKQSVFEPVITGMILAMTASMLVLSYSEVVGFLVSVPSYVGQQLTGSTDVFGAMASTMSSILSSFVAMIVGALAPACGWFNFFGHITSVFFSVLVLLIALFFILMSFVEIVAIAVLAPLSLGLGSAIGIIFVGLLASRWTQKWALKWFEFMLAAAIMNLLLLVAMGLLSTLFAAISAQAQHGQGTFVTALGILLMSAGLGKVFAQIPTMAHAMVPGHSGVSGGGSAVAAGSAQSAKGFGGGGGGGGGIPIAPTRMASAMAPLKVAAAAIGGASAAAAVGLMSGSASAATSAVQAMRGGSQAAGGAGGSTAAPPTTPSE